MCSSKELGLGEDEAGILILESSLALGNNLVESLDLQDSVLDIDILPNRPDCLECIRYSKRGFSNYTKRVKHTILAS